MNPNDTMSHWNPNDTMSNWNPNDTMSHCHPNDTMSHWNPNDTMSHCHPNDTMGHCHPNDTMGHCPGQPLTAVVERIEIKKLRQGDNLILGFSIGGGIDQDPAQNPLSKDKADKGIYVTRIAPKGPADLAGLRMGDKILQVNGWDMTMVTHDNARKRLTKKKEDVVRLLVTRKSLEEAVKKSMGQYHK